MASTYTIKKGDTIDAIAKQLGVDSGQLASANNIQVNSALTEGNVLNVPAVANAVASSTAPEAAKPYTGLSGLSSQTQQQLGQYGQGYTASDSVNAAQQYLQSVINGKPGNYQSQYNEQLESLYNQVMNREPFTFDLNGDMLYNQYKDQYTQMGKQAMMDTMGQAAAMTGGYGNSYAQTAGQQAYQNYLAQLNSMVPELYQMAQDRYNQAGSELMDKLSLTQGLENDAYGKYRDTVSDWNAERDYASGEYWNQYNADYSDYSNMLNYWNNMAQMEHSQYNTNKEMAYAQAMAAIQAGVVPSDELLAAAGISAADAKAMAKAYKRGGSSRSSSGGSSGGSYKGGSYGGDTPAPTAATPTDKQTKYANNLYTYLSSGAGANSSYTVKVNRIAAAENSNSITAEQAKELKRKLNI